ncbi:MAG: hypothetical protein AB2L21_04700 [Anaerolineaceae bacterium]
MENNHTHWYLLTGLILGIAFGLVISLWLAPAIAPEAIPAELSSEAKDEYRVLIAKSYLVDFNLERAESRLALLQDSNPADALSAQAQQVVASGSSEVEARALAQLAAALGTFQPAPTAIP